MSFVKSIHVHESQERNYDKKADTTVLGGVAYAWPTESLGEPSRLVFDVWTLNASAVRDVQINGTLDVWMAERRAAGQNATAVPGESSNAAA